MPSASPPVFKQKVKGRAQKAVRRIIGWHPTSLFPVSISSTFFLLFKCKWTMHDLNSIQFRILLFVNVVIALLIIDRVRSLTAHFLSWSLTGLCVSSTCHSLRLSSAMDRITVYYYYYCINNYWTITACQLPHSWYLIHYYKYPSYSIYVFFWVGASQACVCRAQPPPVLRYGQNHCVLLEQLEQPNSLN